MPYRDINQVSEAAGVVPGLTSRRAFQSLLAVLGSVAIVAGLGTVFFGVDSIVGAEGATATIDSEMRFYAVWYVGAGALLWWSALNLERAGALIRGFPGPATRCGPLAWAVLAGGRRTSSFSQTLMVIELVLPFVIVGWQVELSRRDR